MTPEELVAATAAPIQSLGAAYYFDPATLAHGKEELGLDGMRFYFLGRGGMMGDVEAPMVTSAFGYFAPGVVTKLWNSGRETCDAKKAAAAAMACNAELGRAKLADVDGLEAFCEAAEQVVADVNPAGLALYAGAVAMPLPEDPPARAMQLCIVHRELRGSAHLAAIVAAGLDPAIAHAIRRPGDVATFGWPDDLVITDADRDLLAQVDATTDAVCAAHYASLSDDQRAAFAAGAQAMAAAFA